MVRAGNSAPGGGNTPTPANTRGTHIEVIHNMCVHCQTVETDIEPEYGDGKRAVSVHPDTTVKQLTV